MYRVLLPVLAGCVGLLAPGVALAQAAETPAPPPAAAEVAAEPAGPAPADAPPAAPAVDPGEYNRQLLSIEEDVHALKERVFRAKATLQLLKEIVVQGSAAGSRATVWHENKLGRAYQVDSIAYYVDGQSKFTKADPSGSLDQMTEFKVFEGAVPPGEHSLTVSIKLRGTGYGIFSYARSIEMNVQASTAFIAEEGKDCSVRSRVDERKGIGRSFVERPRVEFTTTCVRSADAVGSP